MVADLRYHSGADWNALDAYQRAEAAMWWQSIRVRELHRLGAIGDDGCLKVRC